MTNKYRVHKDCFAFVSDTEKGCNILKKLYCKFSNCKFYKTKVRIGCTLEEMPQGEEYKDFYFSDNYVGNLSTIAYDYLKESGKPGECVPILDDKNIVRGLRVIIYEEDATLNYKCVKIKNNNGEEENE